MSTRRRWGAEAQRPESGGMGSMPNQSSGLHGGKQASPAQTPPARPRRTVKRDRACSAW
jgi:hypothetical protein